MTLSIRIKDTKSIEHNASTYRSERWKQKLCRVKIMVSCMASVSSKLHSTKHYGVSSSENNETIRLIIDCCKDYGDKTQKRSS